MSVPLCFERSRRSIWLPSRKRHWGLLRSQSGCAGNLGKLRPMYASEVREVFFISSTFFVEGDYIANKGSFDSNGHSQRGIQGASRGTNSEKCDSYLRVSVLLRSINTSCKDDRRLVCLARNTARVLLTFDPLKHSTLRAWGDERATVVGCGT